MSPSPLVTTTVSDGLAILIASAAGRARPWSPLKTLTSTWWGNFAACPIPETRTISWFAFPVRSSAFFTALRIGKLPHPGHQAFSTSVSTIPLITAPSRVPQASSGVNGSPSNRPIVPETSRPVSARIRRASCPVRLFSTVSVVR